MNKTDGWGIVKIQDICRLGRGRVISNEEIKRNPGIFPVYSSQSTNKGKMGSIDSFDFDGEYITWTTDGAYAGTVFYRNGKFNCTNVCGTLQATSPNICMPFIAYKLSTVAKSYVSYIGNPKLMNGVMANINLFVPNSESEQLKIAEILSTVDRAIEQTEALIAKHQRIKAGLMQDLLTRGIDEEGNIRTEETHEFKDSPLGRIPVEWEIKRISEIGSIFTGTTPSTFNQTFWNGEIVWVTPHDLSKLTTPYLVNSAKKIAAKGLKSYSLNLLPAGSIIISSRAPIGYIAISKMSFCTNQGCKSIKLKEEFVPEFIYYNMALNINWIKQLGEGTTFAEISKDALSAIKLAVPTSKYEQTEISNIIRTVDLGVEHWQNNYRKLRSLKTALMQDLLTGKVRVTPLLDETEVPGDERGSSHPADSA